MAKRELSIKPSCAAQLFGFPKNRRDSLFEKIEQLLVDPTPDAMVRKALKGHKGVYRLRVGAYRLFYTYGDGWVKLLGIRKREEKTYRQVMAPEAPSAPMGSDPSLPVETAPLVAEHDDATEEAEAPPAEPAEDLPRTLDVAWLRQLHVMILIVLVPFQEQHLGNLM